MFSSPFLHNLLIMAPFILQLTPEGISVHNSHLFVTWLARQHVSEFSDSGPFTSLVVREMHFQEETKGTFCFGQLEKHSDT